MILCLPTKGSKQQDHWKINVVSGRNFGVKVGCSIADLNLDISPNVVALTDSLSGKT